MASLFPCPNSACTYQFDADQLPAAAMVTCPICRTRFPYRAAPKPVAEATNDEGGDMGWTGPSPGEALPRMNRLVNPRFVPKGNKTQLYVMLIAGAAVMLTLAYIVAKMASDKPFARQGEPVETKFDMYNFKFESPGDNWSLDDATKNAMGLTCFVYKKNDGSAYVALNAEEYTKDKQPRGPYPKETLKITQRKLAAKFKEPSFQAIDKAQLSGRPADAFAFQGESEDGLCHGEVYITDFRGLNYSFIVWAKDDVWADLQGELAKIRGKFQIADGRKDWHGKSSTIFTEAGGNYQLEDVDGVWQQGIVVDPDAKAPREGEKAYHVTQEMIKGNDPNATMLLKAKYPASDRRHARNLLPKADAIVMVVDKKEESPIEQATNYVKDRVKKDEGEDKVTFSDAKDPDKSDDLPSNWNTLKRFSSKNKIDKDQKKFFVVGALTIGNKLIIVEARSSELHSEDMEPFMIRLAASLKERK